VNSAPLPIAVVGAGKAGRQHAAALAATAGCRVAVVVDPDEAAGRQLAQAHGAAWRVAFDDTSDVAAAVVAVPHHLLEGAALRCAEAGLATLLEKPMALDLGGADRVSAAFASRGLPLQVGFVHRFREESRAAYALIREGRIGRPTLVSEVKPYGVQNTPAWVWRRELGGGALLYNGIHGLDRIRWLTGLEALRADAAGGALTHDVDVDDAIAGHLRLSGGALAQVLVQLSPFPMDGHWTTTVYGTEGAIEVRTGHGLRGWGRDGAFAYQVERCDRFAAQAAAFVAAARGSRPPAVTAHDGRAALAIALGLLESAEHAVSVTIDAGPAGSDDRTSSTGGTT
jgi:predicted dehydrogenase